MLVADADLLQADEHADAVVDVDDEIADLQVAKIREERLASPSGAARARAAPPRRRRSRLDLQRRRRAAGSRATDGRRATSTARVVRVLGALDRRGRAPRSRRAARSSARRGPASRATKTIGLAALARRADLGDPVGDAAGELHRRLARDVADARPRCRAPASRARSRRRASARDVVPADDQRRRDAGGALVSCATRLVVARARSARAA